ncbi:MAG: GNAT family N-acetyltransferase [Actinomycetota bacterium]
MSEIDLPAGLTSRPARLEDAQIVTDLFRASEAVDEGAAELTLEDVVSDWSQPSIDPTRDARLVFDGDRLVADAEVHVNHDEATVHPDARGRGIGSALLRWKERHLLEVAPGDIPLRLGQSINERATDAISMFRAHAYEHEYMAWQLRLPPEITIEHPPLPDGVSIRPFVPGREEHVVYRLVEDAFEEWKGRLPRSFEDWKATALARSDFDPSLLLVAVEGEDVVGTAVGLAYPAEGLLYQLAVRRDRRGRGIATALLRASFDALRARGVPEVGLATDSRAGAIGLYQRVGMVVRTTHLHWTKHIRD